MRDVTADRILDVIDDTPRSSGEIMRRLGYNQSWNRDVDRIIRGTLWAHGLVRLTDLGWVRVRRSRF